MTTDIIVTTPLNTIVIANPPESVRDTSDVLTSTSREGQFVHDNQVMGGKRGFRNVSGLWLDKCITIEEGLNRMSVQRQQREDIIENAGNIEFDADDKGLIVLVGDRKFRPTEHALGLICKWFKTPQTLANYYLNPPVDDKYKRDIDDYDIVAYAMTLGKRHIAKDKPLLFRTYKDGTLRAVLSDQYSMIDNEWYLKLIHSIIPDALLSHWKGDADTIYGNVLIPDNIRKETDSEYGGMISIANCEIGVRKLSQFPSIFRAICMNGCIWGKTEGFIMEQRHKGVNLDDLSERIRDNIHRQIPLINSGIDLQLVTRNWKIQTQMVNIAAAIGKEYKIPAEIMGQFMVEYHNQKVGQNCFAAIDALTRVGQNQINPVWVAMDELGGRLTKRGNWNDLNDLGKLIKKEDVSKYVAV